MGSRKKRKRSRFFVYSSVRLFVGVFSSIPLPITLLMGRFVGWAVRLADRRHRLVAMENLDAAYGDSLSVSEKERIIEGIYRNLGMILVELIKTPSLIRRESWRERIHVDGEEHAREAAALGRGVLFISGHLGNWELLGLGITLLGYPLHGMARPLDNPMLDRFLLRSRTRYGQKIVPQAGSFVSFLRILRRGGFVGILVDQNQKEGGVFVDFFGRQAATIRTVAALHRRTGAPIVTGYIRREPGTFRHRIRIDPAIIIERTGDSEGDIRRTTQAFTSRIEEYVRETPDHWLWLHRRWKTRPAGEGWSARRSWKTRRKGARPLQST
ncbi:MAG: lysophospholipid acyltransferase family protein [Planctomycetota bacterium]|nr:lysophospholipid acyltransferase family protein [Planctomycetota bacterium]